MDIYGLITNKLPPIYKTENTLKKYKVISKELSKLYNKIDKLQTSYIIQTADLEHLEVLGDNVNIQREEYQDIEVYRKFVQIAYSNLNFVPTHDELMKVAKRITGLLPIIKPLYTFGEQIENDQGLYIAYDVPNDYNTEVLLNLEKLIGAGIKIRRDLLYRVEGVTLYPATCLFNNDIINIGCEVQSPSQEWSIKQELNIASSYLQIGNTNA